MRTNIMKQRLQRGETALGCSLMFPSPHLVEMLAYAGFHWVLLDCEHGSLSSADVEVMCMAADASGITPIARPRSNGAADIQSVLDRGAHGVQVPHVNSADDARRAVAAVKFGPGAARGLAAGTRPDRWGLGAKMPDFAARQNAETLIAVQIEHADAVRNADEILAVEGIDVFFIGPSDLSQSLGHPGNPREPSVARAIAETLAKIKAAGRTPGMPADVTTLATVRASGCRYIYTHLPKVLGDGARGFLC
jgi:2-keto-3-deoxy-L-rhamnonate aldolase RhmA